MFEGERVPRPGRQTNHSPSLPTPSEPLSVNTVWGTSYTNLKACHCQGFPRAQTASEAFRNYNMAPNMPPIKRVVQTLLWRGFPKAHTDLEISRSRNIMLPTLTGRQDVYNCASSLVFELLCLVYKIRPSVLCSKIARD